MASATFPWTNARTVSGAPLLPISSAQTEIATGLSLGLFPSAIVPFTLGEPLRPAALIAVIKDCVLDIGARIRAATAAVVGKCSSIKYKVVQKLMARGRVHAPKGSPGGAAAF